MINKCSTSKSHSHSGSLDNVVTHQPPQLNAFEMYFADEITVEPYQQVALIGLDKSKQMCKVKTKEATGWIPRKIVSQELLEASLKSKLEADRITPWVSEEVPQRVEQLYRQRRIAQMLDRVKQIEPEDRKIAKEVGSAEIPFVTKTAVTVAPHQTKIVSIVPRKCVNKFCIVEPNVTYADHENLEVLDGSYYKSTGGYIVVRNFSSTSQKIAKGITVGVGKEVEFEKIPFMAQDIVENMCSVSETQTVDPESPKEKSRVRFRERIKNFDPALCAVLGKYEEMFLDPNPMEFETLEIGDLHLPERDDIPDHLPPPHRRVYSKEDEEAIALYVESGLLSGFLRPVDSEFTSPLLVVSKPGSDKKRCCLDARLINEKLLKAISYPMPTTTDIITKMAKNEIFTTLDARSAFNQIRLSERSQKLVAFSVFIGGIRGTYTTTAMPFGIRCAPQAYQKTIDRITHKFKRPHSDADSYIDDLTLGSRSDGTRSAKEIHLEDLDRLLSRLWEVKMRLNLDKCEFLKSLVIFCGHELSKGTYRPSEKHRETIRNLKPFSVLDNTKNALGRYLGVLGYHRRFGGKKYAHLEKSMRKIVEQYKKKAISPEEADSEIMKISEEMKSEILKTKLVIPTGKETLYLNTDASKLSWGAVLSIKNKGVISYHGGTFTKPIINNWSIFAKELKGLLNGLEYNKEFLIKAPEVVVSVDNMATVLSSTTTKPHTKSSDIVTIMRIQQLIGMCQGKVTVKHCSGNSNLLADFCSRLIYADNDKPVAHMASMCDSVDIAKPEEMHIPQVGCFPACVELDSDKVDQYIKLKEEHQSHHYSLSKTLSMLRERDREANKKIIKRVIAECPNCCSIPKRIAPYGRLSLTPTPYKPFMHLSVDFVFPNHESSQGHKAILTARCEFSRYTVGIPVKGRGINTVIGSLNNILTILGIRPETIALDNEFNTDGLRAWSNDTGIKVHFRCSNNSRSIGVERVHQDVHAQWAKVMFDKNPRSWHLRMRDIIDPLNKSVHSVTGVSPYKLVFGIPAASINDSKILDKSSEARKREQLYKLVRRRTLKSKMSYSKEHRWPSLIKGEQVIVKYTNNKSEKERPGVVHIDSGSENPRVEIHFPDNPPKFKYLGIHKGHIFKRMEPLEPLITPGEIQNYFRPPESSVCGTVGDGLIYQLPLVQHAEREFDTCDTRNSTPKRPKRTRKAPDRLQV